MEKIVNTIYNGSLNSCLGFSNLGVNLIFFFGYIDRFNIRVNAVLPGFIETPMTETVPEHLMQMTKLLIPLCRLGNPDGKCLYWHSSTVWKLLQELQCSHIYEQNSLQQTYLLLDIWYIQCMRNSYVFWNYRNSKYMCLLSIRQKQLHYWCYHWSYR